MADPRFLETIGKLLELAGTGITQGAIPAQQFNIGLEEQALRRGERATERRLSREERAARDAESLRRFGITQAGIAENQALALRRLGLSEEAGVRAGEKFQIFKDKPATVTDPLIGESRELDVFGKRRKRKEDIRIENVTKAENKFVASLTDQELTASQTSFVDRDTFILNNAIKAARNPNAKNRKKAAEFLFWKGFDLKEFGIEGFRDLPSSADSLETLLNQQLGKDSKVNIESLNSTTIQELSDEELNAILND